MKKNVNTKLTSSINPGDSTFVHSPCNYCLSSFKKKINFVSKEYRSQFFHCQSIYMHSSLFVKFVIYYLWVTSPFENLSGELCEGFQMFVFHFILFSMILLCWFKIYVIPSYHFSWALACENIRLNHSPGHPGYAQYINVCSIHNKAFT